MTRAGPAYDNITYMLLQKRKAADTEGAKAKKVRKGKNAADTDEDDDEAAPEKKPKKGGRKKKTVKAQANEDVVKA